MIAQKAAIDGQVAIEQQQVDDILHELNAGQMMKPDERTRLMGQLTEAKQKLTSLRAQAEIMASKVADLELCSPLDGQIVTWDVKKLLEGRPVQKGQTLLRVANPEGEWELGLRMPEDRMGFIARAKSRTTAPRAAVGQLYFGHGAGNDADGDGQSDRPDGRSPGRGRRQRGADQGGHQQAGHRSGQSPRGRRRDRQGALRPALAGLRLVPRSDRSYPGALELRQVEIAWQSDGKTTVFSGAKCRRSKS